MTKKAIHSTLTCITCCFAPDSSRAAGQHDCAKTIGNRVSLDRKRIDPDVRIEIGVLNTMLKMGTVKWFNDTKGFGFIEQEDEGEDVFVHHSAIRGSKYRMLKEGQQVKFAITQEGKGARAANVIALEDEKPGFVYLFKVGTLYKIGLSINPPNRVKAVKSPEGLTAEIIHTIKVDHMWQAEAEWHQRFRDERFQLEWFSLTEEDVAEFKSYTEM